MESPFDLTVGHSAPNGPTLTEKVTIAMHFLSLRPPETKPLRALGSPRIRMTTQAPRIFCVIGLLTVPWVASCGGGGGSAVDPAGPNGTADAGPTPPSVPGPKPVATVLDARGADPLVGPAGASPRVALTEIMYHPVAEPSDRDPHEFIEIRNTTPGAIAIGNWKLVIDNKPALTVPAGTTLAPLKFLVLAHSKTQLLAIANYGLKDADVLGDYEGELNNNGSTVALLDEKGQPVDSVKYDDKSPWPIGADAFGGGESWLPKLAPFKSHQYMGRSLERFSTDLPASDPRNWEASPVDGATPGRENSVKGEPPAIVMGHEAQPGGMPGIIKSSHMIVVSAKLSAGKASDLAVEFRVDTAEKIGVPATRPFVASADTTFAATIPAQAVGSIVRYRIVGKRDTDKAEILSPRAGDPFDWHATFVNPDLPVTRTYQMVITPDNWTAMWTNLLDKDGKIGPNQGCVVNPKWDNRQAATFIFNGKVYDVQVRYQGSRYQRKSGEELKDWKVPGPAQPAPNRVFSWRVSFPKWASFEGRDTINLNKQYQACPGVLNSLEGKLFWDAKVPTNIFRFARLHINGAYYAYMMEVENIDERFISKYVEKPGVPVGDMFKFDGSVSVDDGPWSRADFVPIVANKSCPQFTPVERYKLTYERQSNQSRDADPAGHADVIDLIEKLNAVKAVAGKDESPDVRAYFDKYFDVPQLLAHFAVRNFVGVWDDGVHNYYLYKRSDGKFTLYPQDFDLDFGGDPVDMEWKGFANPPTMSFFHGEQGAAKTAGAVNQLKVQFIRAFRKEFVAQIQTLATSVLSEANIAKHLDAALADFSTKDWDEAPVHRCDMPKRIESAKTWLKGRRAFLDLGIK